MATRAKKKAVKRTARARKPVGKTARKGVRKPVKKVVKPMAEPPRTTTAGWFTAPKFGSAGSGGAEYEPGPEED